VNEQVQNSVIKSLSFSPAQLHVIKGGYAQTHSVKVNTRQMIKMHSKSSLHRQLIPETMLKL